MAYQRLAAFGPGTGDHVEDPLGQEAVQSSTSLTAVSGASTEALSTNVLPAVSAMAIFSAPRATGAFHGMMPPTTPSGSRRE